MIQSHLGRIERARNWLGKYKFMESKGIGKDIVGERLEELNKTGDIDKELKRINSYLRDIDNMIGGSVFENKKGREWLTKFLRGNQLERQEK